MIRASAIIAVSCVLLTGCANLLTIDRKTRTSKGGLAIHLDAKQRLAVQNGFGTFCAEPAPDALSVAAASFGAGAAATGQGSAAVATSLSEGAANIGLRTQSITLMRDSMYRICELYYGRAFDGSTAAMMHEGYKDVLVAVLAIEQLTGPVQGQQVALTSGASAAGSAVVGAVDDELKTARSEEATAQTKLSTEEDNVTDKQEALDRANEAVDQARADGAPTATINARLSDRDSAEDDLDKAKRDRDLAKQDLENKRAARQILENTKQAAIASANSASETDAQFNTGARNASNLSDASVEKVAETVKAIVQSVTDKDRISQQCAHFLMQRGSALYTFSGGPNRHDQDHVVSSIREVKDMCIERLKNEMQWRTASIPPPPKPKSPSGTQPYWDK